MTRPGHQAAALDGRLEDGVIAAGFIESESGCVWVIHLTPQQAGGAPAPAAQ
jgi:hypothetical protein